MHRTKFFLMMALVSILMVSAFCRSSIQRSAAASSAQNSEEKTVTVDTVKVVSQKLKMTVRLPGELRPFEVVAVFPKVTGFLKWIGVDRGSFVKKGERIAQLEAPELVAQKAEAQAKLHGAEAQLTAAQAKLAADESTYEKLQGAAQTPGVVAGNDLVVAQKAAEAARAWVKSLQNGAVAAREALRSLQEMESYLRIVAPFDGLVTERNAHPGALVGSAGGPGVTVPLVRIETVSRLRLIVPVPESYIAGISEGTKVAFTVAAFPGVTFSAPIARISHSVDPKTRTMPVEMDVTNASSRLAAGTFSEVMWPVSRPAPTLFVPPSAIARTTERTFVVRVRNGQTEWVDVKTGAVSDNLVEAFGELREGDEVALRASDELRAGTRVKPQLVKGNP